MHTHPLAGNPRRWTAVAVSALFLAGIQAALLMAYTGTPALVAAIDGMLCMTLLTALGYYAWFVSSFVPFKQTRIVLGILAISMWITGCFFIRFLIGEAGREVYPFGQTLPFRIVFGILVWTCIVSGYRIQILTKQLQTQEEEVPADEPELLPHTPVTKEEENECINRITVKDGSRIHLIDTEKLLYIQACGDYVTLVTAEGQYVKEQTMKYFETHLSPSLFVRIHRSYIVNVSQVSRVELFGKENYQMLLKNGTKLKMSSSGYKLLKDKLNL